MELSQRNKIKLGKYLSKISDFFLALVKYIIIIGICFIILNPIIYKTCLTFMQQQDLYDITVRYIPRHFTLANVMDVFTLIKYKEAGLATLSLSIVQSILQLGSCTLIGYGFARFKFPGRDILFACVILSLIIPPQIIFLPLFLHFRFFDIFGLIHAITGIKGINLIGTYWPYILTSITGFGFKNGLFIYIMRQFFRNMPNELEEASYVDGLGCFKTFLKIMLPSAVPSMVTVFLFSFVWSWTDVYYASMFLQGKTNLTGMLMALPSNALIYFNPGLAPNEASIDPVFVSMLNNTGSMLVMLPLVLIYIICQKYFVEGVERSGIVG